MLSDVVVENFVELLAEMVQGEVNLVVALINFLENYYT